ncbi:MAG: hypothetical protein GX298_06895 [Planctomycetes bacterium]|jgi:hypothetical protein|nr:hypothetical protein [Planctomycetota bacterium]
MALVSLNLKPSEKQLRDFGDIALCMCNIVGMLLMGLAGLPVKAFVVICLIGVAVYLLSRISVQWVRPIYIGLMVVSFPIGWLISHILMGLFYYGIISAVGLFFRLLKRDPLHRTYDPEADTYWLPYRHKRTPKDYFHQF